MAGFLYYLPGEKQRPGDERLRELGLPYVAGRKLFASDIHQGPDGGHGWLMADQGRLGDYAARHMPAEQDWQETPDGWWLGYYKAAPPTPDDLAHDQQLPGYDLTMGDGNVWTLPLVRNVDEAGEPVCMLPAKLVRDKATRALVPGPPIERYRYLWEATEWAWLAMVSESDVDDVQAEQTMATIFGANYAVGTEELIACGVYTTDLIPTGLLALAISYRRWQAWREAKKKTPPQSETGGPSTCDGETG